MTVGGGENTLLINITPRGTHPVHSLRSLAVYLATKLRVTNASGWYQV